MEFIQNLGMPQRLMAAGVVLAILVLVLLRQRRAQTPKRSDAKVAAPSRATRRRSGGRSRGAGAGETAANAKGTGKSRRRKGRRAPEESEAPASTPGIGRMVPRLPAPNANPSVDPFAGTIDPVEGSAADTSFAATGAAPRVDGDQASGRWTDDEATWGDDGDASGDLDQPTDVIDATAEVADDAPAATDWIGDEVDGFDPASGWPEEDTEDPASDTTPATPSDAATDWADDGGEWTAEDPGWETVQPAAAGDGEWTTEDAAQTEWTADEDADPVPAQWDPVDEEDEVTQSFMDWGTDEAATGDEPAAPEDSTWTATAEPEVIQPEDEWHSDGEATPVDEPVFAAAHAEGPTDFADGFIVSPVGMPLVYDELPAPTDDEYASHEAPSAEASITDGADELTAAAEGWTSLPAVDDEHASVDVDAAPDTSAESARSEYGDGFDTVEDPSPLIVNDVLAQNDVPSIPAAEDTPLTVVTDGVPPSTTGEAFPVFEPVAADHEDDSIAADVELAGAPEASVEQITAHEPVVAESPEDPVREALSVPDPDAFESMVAPDAVVASVTEPVIAEPEVAHAPVAEPVLPEPVAAEPEVAHAPVAEPVLPEPIAVGSVGVSEPVSVEPLESERVAEVELLPTLLPRVPNPLNHWNMLEPSSGPVTPTRSPMNSWARLAPGRSRVAAGRPVATVAAPTPTPAPVGTPSMPQAWWDGPEATVDSSRRGRFAVGGYAIAAGHHVVAGVTFRDAVIPPPSRWMLGPVTGAVPAGTLVLNVDGCLNCSAADLSVLVDAGFAPSTDGFSLRLASLEQGPFAASGTYEIH